MCDGNSSCRGAGCVGCSGMTLPTASQVADAKKVIDFASKANPQALQMVLENLGFPTQGMSTGAMANFAYKQYAAGVIPIDYFLAIPIPSLDQRGLVNKTSTSGMRSAGDRADCTNPQNVGEYIACGLTSLGNTFGFGTGGVGTGYYNNNPGYYNSGTIMGMNANTFYVMLAVVIIILVLVGFVMFKK